MPGKMPGVYDDSSEVRPRSLKTSLAAVFRMWLYDNLRRNPSRGRKILLRAIGMAVAATGVVTVVISVLALSFVTGTADKLAAVGDVLVGATLILAGIAAVVALLAYAVSTGPPDLQVRIRFNFSDANNPVFKAHVHEFGWLAANPYKQLTGVIQIRNNSSYSARNPAVAVRLYSMAFLREHEEDAWVVTSFITTNGIKAVQWDGGPTYSIHGNSTRRLPDLNLDKLHTDREQQRPALGIELLADGYRKEIFIPVDFTVDDISQGLGNDREVNPEWM